MKTAARKRPRPRRSGQPNAKILAEVCRRIVQSAHPLRIVLFGSAARGEMGPNSDLDLLVIMPDGTHRRHTAQALYPKLFGVDFAVDIVVATVGDLERYRDDPYMVHRHALREGREIYPNGT
jgi:uncharacterized protein